MRYFTIQGSGIKSEGGRYAAKDDAVSTAAKKAGSRLYRELSEAQITARESKNLHGIKFILRETTKGSKKHTYYYKIVRIPLSVPKMIKIGTSTIEYKYKFELKRCDQSSVEKEMA
jgi:hypothetical protein